MGSAADTLGARRLAVLVRQIHAEDPSTGWQTRLAKRIGCSQGLVSLIDKGERFAGIDVIEKAMKAFRLQPRYFLDATLGAEPDYRSYVRGATDPEGPRVLAVVDEFLAGPDGPKVREVPTVSMIRDIWLQMLAEEAGRAVAEPVVRVKPRPGRRKIGGGR